MLNPKKKITRKEIKQDGLITAYGQATTLYYENKKYVTYGLTALAIVVVVSFVYFNNRRANNEKAVAEFGKVFSIFDEGGVNRPQYKVAIDGQPERGIMGLKAIVDNYGGTQAGELARFYLASAYFQLRQYDDALKQFDSFSGSSDFLKASALAGVGGCYEAKGDYGKAAAAYEKASNTITDQLTTADYLNSAARDYGYSGDKAKAVALFKRIKKDYPNSSFARDAEKYIARFSV